MGKGLIYDFDVTTHREVMLEQCIMFIAQKLRYHFDGRKQHMMLLRFFFDPWCNTEIGCVALACENAS
jgi:hypothetical protein